MESVCQSVRHDSMPLHYTCTLVQRHTGFEAGGWGYSSVGEQECLIRVSYRGQSPSRPHWIRNQVAKADASI
jgi:hypothetical protein